MARLVVICGAMQLALACTPAVSSDAGTTTSDGGVPRTDAGVDGGVLDASVPDPGYPPGTRCNPDLDLCGDGKKCANPFPRFVWEEEATCYVTCNDVGTSCTPRAGRVGVCREYFGDRLCVAVAEPLGGCGNAINTVCLYDELCDADNLADPNRPGVCLIYCDPERPYTCVWREDPTEGVCGCPAGLACSTDITSQFGSQVDGRCAPPTEEGDTCSFRYSEVSTMALCTDGQRCEDYSTATGRGVCRVPNAGPADAGVIADDAGPSDAGSSDAGSSDAGSSDAGSSDAGSSDAGSSDAG